MLGVSKPPVKLPRTPKILILSLSKDEDALKDGAILMVRRAHHEEIGPGRVDGVQGSPA
jgi:hypothetical protein